MKCIFTLIFSIHSLFFYPQIQTKTQKAIKILEPQSFYLNGGAKSMAGGNSRTGFKIDLPQNTVEWYYAFTTEPNKNSNQNLQLEKQLSYILSASGFTSNIVNLIKIPIGQGLIDIYLTDRRGYNLFFEKDFLGMWKYTAPGHSIEGSTINAKDGKIKIDDIRTGSHFLVIRNTSATTGINIKLEVVAIVEEIITDMTVWDKRSKDLLFNSFKKDIQKAYPYYSEDKVDEITGCVIEKITSELKPSDVNTLAEYELKKLIKNHYSNCSFSN